MPKVLNDQMVRIKPEDKEMIKKIGYYDAARAVGRTESYLRSLASKGGRLIRKSHLERLKEVYART